MYQGFYNLTSGMLTQQRNLNVVGNNLVNISTAGFKQDRYTASTFDEVMYSRVGACTAADRRSGSRAISGLPAIFIRILPRALWNLPG